MSQPFLSDSHQIPIRLPSSSFQIPQRNLIQFGANQLPISLLSDPHQKNQIHQCNFGSKPPHLQGCLANFNFLAKTATVITGLLSDSYQIPIIYLSAIHQNPIGNLSDPHQIPPTHFQNPIRSLSDPYQIPIIFLLDPFQIPKFNFGANTTARITGGMVHWKS